MGKLKYGAFFMLTATGGLFLSCAKTQSPQNNATINQANNTPVNIQVLISSHPNLNGVGGIDTIPNVGLKGILI